MTDLSSCRIAWRQKLYHNKSIYYTNFKPDYMTHYGIHMAKS